MNRFKLVSGITGGIFLLLLFTWVGCVYKVPAGHVGIKVYLLGKSKGVDSEALGVGRYLIGINEELYLYPTYTKNYVWQASGGEDINIQTKEGLTVNADVGIQFRIDPSKANELFQTYRKGIDEITNVVLRNATRDVLNKLSSTMSSEAIYGTGRVELIDQATLSLQNEFNDEGILIEKVYWTGNMRLPEKIKNALDAKIEAIQRSEQRENELREALAQAKIDSAKAKGQADKLRQEREQLSPLLIQKMWIEKWDGKVPQYVLGGNTNMMLNLPK